MSRINTLGRALGRGSAKHGVDHWWSQRTTAVALAVLSVWFVVSLLSMPTMDYVTLWAWMGHGWNAVPLVGLILAAARHSYLGLRVVVEDYVHAPALRIGTLLLLSFAHMLVAAAAVFSVLDVAFGDLP